MLDNIKIGDSVFVNYFALGIISKFTYIGDGFFKSTGGSLSNLKLSKIKYSLSEEEAKYKLFQYKLSQLHQILDGHTKKAMQTKESIDALHNEFIYLKNKFPEEFI